MESAEEYKAKGNEFWKKGALDDALDMYTKGLEVDPTSYLLFSNRSAVYLGLSEYEKSIHDADKAIELNPTFSKAYNRKAIALREMGNLEESVKWFYKSLDLDPSNVLIQKEINHIEGLLEGPKFYSTDELDQLPVLDNRSIAGDFYQMRYITFSQFDSLLKDLLQVELKLRLGFTRDLFALIHEKAATYKILMRESIEKGLCSEINNWFRPLQRNISSGDLVDQIIKSCIERPQVDDDSDIVHDSKTIGILLEQVMDSIGKQLDMFGVNEKARTHIRSGIESIMTDLCWIDLRMQYSSPQGHFFVESKVYDAHEDCPVKGTPIFTVHAGYQTEEKVFLNPIAYTE